MQQSLDWVAPTVHESAYVHPQATLIGDVTLEAEASVWPGTVLRGDEGGIVLRAGSNVQDNAVCHETVEIGPAATVGHGAIIHHCTVGERALVGMNAVVLDGATVGAAAIVAAGSVVTEDTEVAPGSLVAGTPATVVREDLGESGWAAAGEHYVELSRRYLETADVVAE
jgi:carbonic anhydrase/acetyltransferase-like protein (isoleucine patch superfamily)